MGAEFIVNSALFCIFLFFCARTSNSYVCKTLAAYQSFSQRTGEKINLYRVRDVRDIYEAKQPLAVCLCASLSRPFHDSQVLYTIDMTGILAEFSSPTLEDDLVVFNEEEYFNYVVQCLDYGDPLTARETAEELSIEASEMEEGQIQQGARVSTTRSGRKSRRPKETAFLFYD